jgi:Sporulation related domain.
MKLLISHIEYLLTENDCVIVPGWGGFVVQQHNALITESSILPPSREICFNQGLVHDDGILISSISQTQGISYSEARRLLNNEVGIFNAELSHQKSIEFGDIGKFSFDEEHTLLFEPKDNVSTDIECLGFAPLQLKTLEQIQEKAKPQPTGHKPFAEQEGDIIHIRFSKRKMLRVMASAAAIMILWVFSSPVKDQRSNISCAGMISRLEFSKPHSPITPSVKKDTVLMKDTVVVEKKIDQLVERKDSVIEELHYFIVLGSFQTEHAANRHKEQLSELGIPHVGVRKMGSKMHTYLKGFADKDSAMKYLNKIRDDREEYREAWLYCMK